MSKPDITTQDLFLRLGSTAHLRSARADALFRRLRLDKEDQLARALSGAPKRMTENDLGAKPKSKKPDSKKAG